MVIEKNIDIKTEDFKPGNGVAQMHTTTIYSMDTEEDNESSSGIIATNQTIHRTLMAVEGLEDPGIVPAEERNSQTEGTNQSEDAAVAGRMKNGNLLPCYRDNVKKIEDNGSGHTAYMVTIPDEVDGGEKFPITITGKKIMVACPRNARPGTKVRVVPPSQEQERMEDTRNGRQVHHSSLLQPTQQEAKTTERGQMVRQIIEEKVGNLKGDLTIVKHSINDVYRCELETGQKIIVKARPLRNEMVDREKQIMKLLRYASKYVKTCNYYGPGIIEADALHISLLEEIEGRFLEARDILNKECCEAIGKWIRDFHKATKKLEHEFPEIYRRLPKATETPHAHLLAKCRVPKYKKRAESYGIIHGDCHTENFFLAFRDPSDIVFFDFENLSKDLYLVDLGYMICTVCTRLNWASVSTNEVDILKHKQNFCNWMCEGYSNNEIQVDRELLRQCCIMGADLTTVCFRMCLENGWRADIVEHMQKYVNDHDAGKHEFFDVLFGLTQTK